MDVIVVDLNYKFMEGFTGQYKNGVLVHKRGEKRIGLFGITIRKWGGELEEMEFDYEKTMDLGNRRLAMYQWDGKNLHQLSFFDVPESSTLVDYKNSWEIAKLAEETTIKAPPADTITRLAFIISILALLGTAVIGIIATNSDMNTLTKSLQNTPVANISQQNAKTLAYMSSELNLTQSQVRAQNQYLYNLSKYISYNTGGQGSVP